MDLNSITSQLSEMQLGLAGGAILIFSIFLGIIKGVFRIILGIAGLIAAAVAFWFVFRHGDSLASRFIEDPDPWVPLGLGGGAAAGAYMTVRHGIGIILRPLIGSVDDMKRRRLLSGLMGLGLGGAGLYGGGTASHQFDAMSFLEKDLRGGEPIKRDWFNTLLVKTQDTWFGKLQQYTDPAKTAYRCDLIKALDLYTSGRTTEFPQASLTPILANNEFRRLASSPAISQALNEDDFQALFRNKQIEAFIDNKENLALLDQIDWTATL